MKVDVTPQQHLELYYYMKLNRGLEEAMVRLFRQNKIVGGLYSSLGQEAISVGTAYALEKKDWLAPMIRNIGALLVKGFRPRDIFTQHMAKYTSPTLGKDGTSHFGDLEKLHTAVMAGIAIAGRYLGQNIVALTWIGDGGSSTGVFHEGLDFAAVQKAPLVLVLENNQWAYSTPVRRQVPLENLADRAKAYGIDSYVVDGNDVVAVYTTAKEAVNRCRAGQGPILIEAKTMRMKGHAQHDPAEYVPAEMFAYWKQRDPIERYEKFLMAGKILDAKKKAEIEARIEREIEADREFAEASPLPPPELAEQGVYCDGCHTIAANWVRPKEEVMPPKSGVAPVWKVAAYGEALRPAEFVPAADAASGNGARPVSKSRGKAPAAAKASPKKLVRAGAARKVRR